MWSCLTFTICLFPVPLRVQEIAQNEFAWQAQDFLHMHLALAGTRFNYS